MLHQLSAALACAQSLCHGTRAIDRHPKCRSEHIRPESDWGSHHTTQRPCCPCWHSIRQIEDVAVQYYQEQTAAYPQEAGLPETQEIFFPGQQRQRLRGSLEYVARRSVQFGKSSSARGLES